MENGKGIPDQVRNDTGGYVILNKKNVILNWIQDLMYGKW